MGEKVMQGIVRAYVPDKGYGFIKGDDGKDYFFRKESFTDAAQVERIADEAVVTFEECATPKGYRANRLSLVSRTSATTFVLPDEVLISKTDRLHRWELVEIGDWIVHGASRHSPDQARKELQQNARRIGVNALLCVEYYKSTGHRATKDSRFTIFAVMSRRWAGAARAVRIGKRIWRDSTNARERYITNLKRRSARCINADRRWRQLC
jgi:cold shock CspA family protein